MPIESMAIGTAIPMPTYMSVVSMLDLVSGGVDNALLLIVPVVAMEVFDGRTLIYCWRPRR
jgi:hypothetical protein